MATKTPDGKGGKATGASGPVRADASTPQAVKPFGKYFLVRKLAEGGMAEIFLAKQVGVEGFEKNVVIKRMLQHLSSVPDFVSMFLDEARLAARLSHPNVVTISDLGHADGCYYICMEYLAGEDFSTMLRTAARRREYVPLHISLRVLAEAARGLEFAHNFTDAAGRPLNIVHRDISPSNIFVTYTGQVKVLDFGIAKAESRITNTTAGVVKGKYMYMAPEQARSGQVDRRADVFSLGVSLYEALTNTRPFARDNDLAILNAVLQCDYKPPRQVRPDLSLELEAVVVKALALKVEDRYQSAGDFANDLERFLAATTSGSGGTAVSTFMSSFFGPERVAQKTRIDSLEEMAQKGLDVPGLPNPHSPKTDPASTVRGPQTQSGPSEQDEGATKAVGVPNSVVADRRKKTGAVLIGAVVGLLVLGAAVAVGYRWLTNGGNGGSGGGGAALVADSGSVGAADDAGAGGGGGEALVDAGAAGGAGEGGGATASGGGASGAGGRDVRPLEALTTAKILKVVRAHQAELAACFDKNKADLPSDRGVFSVDFTVGQSGKVTKAVSELPDKGVGKCVEREFKTMKFPPHRDREVAGRLPLSYTVK